MIRPFTFALAFALALPAFFTTAQANPSQEMIYGPHQMMTFDGKSPSGNVAYKGAVIKLSDENGGAYVCFDTELLRYAAAWTGGFINFEGVSYKGDHGKNPGPAGKVQFTTGAAPGWADPDGKFEDTRPHKPYGNLPRNWGHYKGLYHHGNQVVLKYTIGNATILEMPHHSQRDGTQLFTRLMSVQGSDRPMQLTIADLPGGKSQIQDGIISAPIKVRSQRREKDPATKKDREIEVNEDATLFVAIQNAPEGAAISMVDGSVRVSLPKLHDGAQFSIITAVGPESARAMMRDLTQMKVKQASLDSFTKGGPRLWTEEVKVQGTLGDADAKGNAKAKAREDAPYVVDTITVPYKNPYKSWMRTGGFDFFKDQTTAAITTWSGDVWIVKGIDDKLENITWTRFATGIHDGLGLKIVDEVIYVHGRDGITRLHDLNNDGQADFYENFNNDILITHGFHEFSYELHTDKQGNFYFAKGGAVSPGGRGWQTIVPHHGCAFRLSKDGTKLEVIATGLRAPNGMAVGPNGEITTGDNEGTWVPKSRINYWTADQLAKRKGFGGVTDLSHMDPKPTIYDAPICWIPKNVCNSGGGQAWVTSDKWGPFAGDLLYASYGTCSLFKVLKEEVDGPDGKIVQGGVVRFPLKFDSGTCRLRFNERDGQLYVMGIKGWQSSAAKDGSFQRVRYTGKAVNMPTALKAGKAGLTITFTAKLDKELAQDLDSYQIQQWNYRWSGAYGSEHWKVSNPQEKGADKVNVKSAKLLADGRSVFLEIEGLQPVMQMHVKYALETEAGDEVKGEIFNTINKLGADAALASQ